MLKKGAFRRVARESQRRVIGDRRLGVATEPS
jgi:hypothetical protein